MARRREFNVFNLSFLDIMSCGFGAVILIYIVINHSTEASSQETNKELLAEATRIEELIKNETAGLIMLRNTVEEKEDEIATAEQRAKNLVDTIKKLEAQLAMLDEGGASQKSSVEALKSELKQLEEDAANLKASLAADEKTGRDLRAVAGHGDRQYLTGLNMGGSNILILLDASASMLDQTIVNIIRRRNLPDGDKKQSEKWQRAIRTVEWIVANMPKDAEFQLVTFNKAASATHSPASGDWLQADAEEDQDHALAGLRDTVPEGGTSLVSAFEFANAMKPKPDNIFLIIDSLPTLGKKASRKSVIDSRARKKLLDNSLKALPKAALVNIILFPIEGDPLAAPYYWKLAQTTGGTFLAPPKDWP